MTRVRIRISRAAVEVLVPEEMLEWPAHHKELMEKIEELNAYIYSIETGRTEPWRSKRVAGSPPAL